MIIVKKCASIFAIMFQQYHNPRSQTYSAKEVDLVLANSEDGSTIEWVDIDPEAFTGALETHTVHTRKTEVHLA